MQDSHMTRSIDITELPLRKYANKAQIDWDMAVGSEIPFIYDSITGTLTVLEHHKGNYIVIGYQDKTKRLRTNHLFRMQFRDLIDPDKELLYQPNVKSQQVFLTEVEKRYQDEYEVLSAYRGSKKPILIQHNCSACSYHRFSPTPNNFLRGSGCPSCNGSPSFPEVCLLLVITQVFPEAKREKIGRRECDIVFYAQGKKIGLQYDGAFYHRNAQKDNDFNRTFLEEENSYLIRIREAGCPELAAHPRMYQRKSAAQYSLENLQKTVSDIFQVIQVLLGEAYQPQLTDEIMEKARQQSKRAYHYKLLMEEYIGYLSENHAVPAGKSADNLQGRVTTAIRERRFREEELARILETKKRYGLYAEERNPDLIYQDMVDFTLQNEILPRQQAGNKDENDLFQEVRKCVSQNLFTKPQIQEYRRLRECTPNYPESADRLYSIYIQFVKSNQRLPGAGNGADEKSLISKVSHRLSRKSFSVEQADEIEMLQRQFSRRLQEHVLYLEGSGEEFCDANQRLPDKRQSSIEGQITIK